MSKDTAMRILSAKRLRKMRYIQRLLAHTGNDNGGNEDPDPPSPDPDRDDDTTQNDPGTGQTG